MAEKQEKPKSSESTLQENYEGIGGFLSGLWDAMKMGAQNTVGAIQDDIADIQERRMPHNLSRDIPGLLSMMGQPSINPIIPALGYTKYLPGPIGESGAPEFLMKESSKVYPGGNVFQVFGRQGAFGDWLKQILRELDTNY